MNGKASVFVKVEEYRDVLDIINLIKQRVKQARALLYQISELKSQEDAELSRWSRELEEIEGRINSIDKSLFEPEA